MSKNTQRIPKFVGIMNNMLGEKKLLFLNVNVIVLGRAHMG